MSGLCGRRWFGDGEIRHTPIRTRDNEVTVDVTLELPEDLARLLGEDAVGLRRAALEALTLEGLRSGTLTVSQARRLLGIASRYEMDGFLKSHGIFPPLSVEDVERDANTAGGLRNR